MKFPKGQSGNPDGRPPGTKNKATQIREALANDLEAVLDKVKQAALAGDMTAARLILERALPAQKPTVAPIKVPGLNEATTLAGKAEAVLAAMGRGEMPPDMAAHLIAAIGHTARVIEVSEILSRIEALEAKE